MNTGEYEWLYVLPILFGFWLSIKVCKTIGFEGLSVAPIPGVVIIFSTCIGLSIAPMTLVVKHLQYSAQIERGEVWIGDKKAKSREDIIADDMRIASLPYPQNSIASTERENKYLARYGFKYMNSWEKGRYQSNLKYINNLKKKISKTP